MIYTLQKRHEFAYGSMFTHYEVVRYTHINKMGILMNGETSFGEVLKKGTKKECSQYIKSEGIQIYNQ